jgi:A/G-specific adenine glycosylase
MKRISERLLNWYHRNKRILPWRGHPDPYAVWVSEIMLQQTRVEAVIPYFEKWMRLFPTIRALAAASEQDVLNAWEGLGYYSRARNLHKAAKTVTENYGGELPRDLDQLRALPGIGRYTLGAISSIAFGMNTPALDGNIKRVYARVFDLTEPVDAPRGEKLLWEIAEKYLPKQDAGDYNQALMDLGATICVPKNPRCLICPLMKVCEARIHGTQNERPVKVPKREIPHHIHAAGVILQRGRVLLAKRPLEGLLGGMWEFPNGRVDSQGDAKGDPLAGLAEALKREYGLRLRVSRRLLRTMESIGIIHHGYSHFSVDVYVYLCQLATAPTAKNLKWIWIKDLDDFPMGKIDRRIATLVQNRSNS